MVPAAPPDAPRWGNRLTRAVGRTALGLFKWHILGEIPRAPKLVIIAAPHTSTLDVFVGLATLLALGLRVRWLGKHTIFRPPVGWILRWLGGMPVDRRAPHGFVGRAVELVTASDRIFLALSPEGTRGYVGKWKSGYYRIAVACGVPIVPVALDYDRSVVEIGIPFSPTGDYDADERHLRRSFTKAMARHPGRYHE